MIWSKLFSLCPEVQTLTGSTEKVSQGKGFPPAAHRGWQAAALCQPHLCPLPAPHCPCPQAAVTSLQTPSSLTEQWLDAASAPGCGPYLTSCIPGAAPASPRERQPWTPPDLPPETTPAFHGGLQTQHLGAAKPQSLCFSLVFCFDFNQQNSLLGLSTPKLEAGGSGEGGGCLAPMSTGRPGAALEFGG